MPFMKDRSSPFSVPTLWGFFQVLHREADPEKSLPLAPRVLPHLMIGRIYKADSLI